MIQFVWLLLLSVVRTSLGIHCFQCDSSKNFSCTENWEETSGVVRDYLTGCDKVFEAAYCVKMTGVFEGKLGTSRFCSSRDWGNYCEYIKRPGDIQEYRSCVYTCTSFGCNGGHSLLPSSWSLMAILMGTLSLAYLTYLPSL